MPYLSTKIKLPNELKRSYKLTEEDKLEIRRIRRDEGLSYQKIANAFNVSKKRVLQICNPDIAERDRESLKRWMKEVGITRERRNQYMRTHRAYKQKLYKEGLI